MDCEDAPDVFLDIPTLLNFPLLPKPLALVPVGVGEEISEDVILPLDPLLSLLANLKLWW